MEFLGWIYWQMLLKNHSHKARQSNNTSYGYEPDTRDGTKSSDRDCEPTWTEGDQDARGQESTAESNHERGRQRDTGELHEDVEVEEGTTRHDK